MNSLGERNVASGNENSWVLPSVAARARSTYVPFGILEWDVVSSPDRGRTICHPETNVKMARGIVDIATQTGVREAKPCYRSSWTGIVRRKSREPRSVTCGQAPPGESSG